MRRAEIPVPLLQEDEFGLLVEAGTSASAEPMDLTPPGAWQSIGKHEGKRARVRWSRALTMTVVRSCFADRCRNRARKAAILPGTRSSSPRARLGGSM